MKSQPLQVFCDDKQSTWALSLDMTGAVARALRLSVAPLSHKGARSGKVVAEIREPRQVDVIISRVGDVSIEPSDLARELMDFLMTLAATRPSGECVDFLEWRLCEWIAENRRRRFKGENAA
jgi:hypothetical protein